MNPNQKRLRKVTPARQPHLSFGVVDANKQWSKLELAFGAFVSSFVVLSTFCAPEGNIREGDFLPVILFFLLFSIGCFFWKYCLNRNKNFNALLETEDAKVHAKRSIIVSLIDRSLWAYLLFATLAYLRAVFGHTVEPRLSTNAYWTFITPVLFFFLLRFFRRFCSKSLFLGLCAVLFASAVAESSFSIYSYAVSNPKLREAYLDNPDKMLRDANLSLAPNSRERELFEKRLLESSEPTGTYGLANTLAGFLAPMLVLGFAGFLQTVSTLQLKQQNRRLLSDCALFSLFAWFLGLVTILCVIVLTKSRAGFLASIFGICLLALYYFLKAISSENKRIKRVAVVGFGALAIMALALTIAFATGVVDREVFTEAGKSFGYRLDYWRATYQMILDHPCLGIGPGEFQSVYPRYILSTASEFIADPHNFAFEIAALFGLPALIAFTFFISNILILSLVGISKEMVRRSNGNQNTEPDSLRLLTSKSLIFGGILGIILLLFCSFLQDTPVEYFFLCHAFVALCVTMICFFSISNQLPESTNVLSLFSSITIVALLLNLCAAGGISYPVASTTLFLLAGFIVNFNDVRKTESLKKVATSPAKLTLRVFWAGIAVLCVFYITAFKPRCNSFLFSLLNNPQNNESKGGFYDECLKLGTVEKVDASSSAVVTQFYYYSGLKYIKNPSKENRERWNRLRAQVKRVAPNSPTIRENCGDFDYGLFLQKKNRYDFLDSALAFYQDAVAFSPTDVGKRVKLFRAYQTKGLLNKALEEAKEALELDETTPHEDRKLEDDVREELQMFIQNTSYL